MGTLRFNELLPNKIMRGSSTVSKIYVGVEKVWDYAAMLEGPKIDPTHDLANRTTMRRLTLGSLEGMTADTNYMVTDDAFASKTAGTTAFAKEAIPNTAQTTVRVSALIKVDKTSGRFSRIGWIPSATATATATSPDIYIGHDAGSGIKVGGQFGGTISLPFTVLEEAKLVDGAWYRVSLIWDSVLHQRTNADNTGRNRIQGAAEPVDPAHNPAVPWYPAPLAGARHNTTYSLITLQAKTNSPLGTIKDFTYVDSMLGITGDDAPIHHTPVEELDDRTWIYSKAKAAPLRIIVTAGGSGMYGGPYWASGIGNTGNPYDKWRQTWRDLANLGYTVMHTQALHEGWGADDHLSRQITALERLKTHFGSDARVYYLGYSMGGLSTWRAIMGRAGFPEIRAAYMVAGAIGLDRYYDVSAFSAIKTRWPNRAELDEPMNYSGSELIARGTRVRLVTSTGDTNMPKVDNHDVMKAKYGGSSLFSELVHDGIDHFNPLYWDVNDMVAFFEGQDAL